MDGRQLNRLGRRLIELARVAGTYPGDRIPSSGETAVLGEVVENPGCSIRQLCERTGFVQSHVSALVAGLVERGLLRTDTDPADRRRTLVYPDVPLTRGVERRRRPIDETLAAALGDPGKAEEAAELLGKLAALLLTDPVPRAPGAPTGNDPANPAS
ncbi:MarR family winged helix-turn-helix transcriptional regulator [Nocardia flavorosea]|uniref:MarR family transcriptional regulator n=1 Tax=Nocardia flavorosea TaxID=53429 RepID=A0A846YQV0_9NOCA|nr:MarR family transcriptional regulator [Nocardia flavorosea]NKY60081.1 MarR family transcriptional regulator [Nocardia flavorosea]